jgi:hypothetical protein
MLKYIRENPPRKNIKIKLHKKPIMTPSNFFKNNRNENTNSLPSPVLNLLSNTYAYDAPYLNGPGFPSDEIWLIRWNKVIELNRHLYDLPSGKASQDFVLNLAVEIDQLTKSKYIAVILQRDKQVKKTKDM